MMVFKMFKQPVIKIMSMLIVFWILKKFKLDDQQTQ